MTPERRAEIDKLLSGLRGGYRMVEEVGDGWETVFIADMHGRTLFDIERADRDLYHEMDVLRFIEAAPLIALDLLAEAQQTRERLDAVLSVIAAEDAGVRERVARRMQVPDFGSS